MAFILKKLYKLSDLLPVSRLSAHWEIRPKPWHDPKSLSIAWGQGFLAEYLKDAGYQTGYIGKWHLEGGPKPGFVPPDRRFGFEHFIGFNRGHDYQSSIYYDDTGQAYHSYRYEPDYQTDQFIDFIDTVAKKDKPFFGYLSFGPPHFPMDMPDDLRSIYSHSEVPLPPGVPDPELQQKVQEYRNNVLCNGDPRSGHKSHCSHETKPVGEVESEEEIREFIAEYYGMIHNIDANLGKIMDRLDQLHYRKYRRYFLVRSW